jgi:hypothetical protein
MIDIFSRCRDRLEHAGMRHVTDAGKGEGKGERSPAPPRLKRLKRLKRLYPGDGAATGPKEEGFRPLA